MNKPNHSSTYEIQKWIIIVHFKQKEIFVDAAAR